MTVAQIGILAGLAVLICIVFSGGAVVILLDAAASSAQGGAVGVSTLAPTLPSASLPTHTLQPTLTPEPTATPGVTQTPIPGWVKFEGGGVELWLPENYRGGNPATDLNAIAREIRALGPDFAGIAAEVEQQLPEAGVSIFAFDRNVGDALTLTTVQIVGEPLDSDVDLTLDEYLNAAVRNLSSDQRVVERRVEKLDRYEAGRLVVDYKITEGDVSVFRKRLIYAIRAGDAMWVVQYLTERDDFKAHLPTFESSIQTFAVQP
jgi:hypothetical protein